MRVYIYIYIYIYSCIWHSKSLEDHLSTSGANTGQPGQEIEGTDSLSQKRKKKKIYSCIWRAQEAEVLGSILTTSN